MSSLAEGVDDFGKGLVCVFFFLSVEKEQRNWWVSVSKVKKIAKNANQNSKPKHETIREQMRSISFARLMKMEIIMNF